MIDRKIFFDQIRNDPFNGLKQGQVEGLNTLLDIFERDYAWPDLRWLAYCLATATWETAWTLQPIAEQGSAAYLKAKPYWPYIGRGYVQLTWEANYRDMGKKLGVDMLGANMERALEPELAAKVLFIGMRDGDFTTKQLHDYFSASVDDPINARRIVNGTDRAKEIADIHADYLRALKAATKPVEAPAPPPAAVVPYLTRKELATALRAMADAIERGG